MLNIVKAKSKKNILWKQKKMGLTVLCQSKTTTGSVVHAFLLKCKT